MLNPSMTGLRCFACETPHDFRVLQTVCTKCGMPLRVDYALRKPVFGGPASLWRYQAVLPLKLDSAVTLQEGFTPLIPSGDNLWIKDESRNPTGSFKARGMTHGRLDGEVPRGQARWRRRRLEMQPAHWRPTARPPDCR